MRAATHANKQSCLSATARVGKDQTQPTGSHNLHWQLLLCKNKTVTHETRKSIGCCTESEREDIILVKIGSSKERERNWKI